MPLPSTTVIPHGWAQHHAPTAASAMTGTCQIHDPTLATDTFNRQTGQTNVTAGPPAYTGPCRVQALSQRGEATDAVGQDVTLPAYLVELPLDAAPVDEGWAVLVTACPDDVHLVGRTLTIQQVVYGTQRFTRVLFCDDE